MQQLERKLSSDLLTNFHRRRLEPEPVAQITSSTAANVRVMLLSVWSTMGRVLGMIARMSVPTMMARMIIRPRSKMRNCALILDRTTIESQQPAKVFEVAAVPESSMRILWNPSRTRLGDGRDLRSPSVAF
jgi:hypothetical protein